MRSLDSALTGLRAAVAALLAAADREGAAWSVPRAPGKWSPSQVVEHVTRLADESAKVVSGTPSKFPTLNAFMRTFARFLFFKRALRNDKFPAKLKTIPDFDPIAGSATPNEARVRLESVLARFEQACRARSAAGEDVGSTLFGHVPVPEFATFQELHIRHHVPQMVVDQ